MNDFDRFLELKLRDMLDPVVTVQPPRGRRRQRRPVLAVLPPATDLVAEPVMVTVPVAPIAPLA